MIVVYRIRRLLRRLGRDRRGASAVEYGFMIAVIVLAMVGALSSVADKTTGMWGTVSNKVTNAG